MNMNTQFSFNTVTPCHTRFYSHSIHFNVHLSLCPNPIFYKYSIMCNSRAATSDTIREKARSIYKSCYEKGTWIAFHPAAAVLSLLNVGLYISAYYGGSLLLLASFVFGVMAVRIKHEIVYHTFLHSFLGTVMGLFVRLAKPQFEVYVLCAYSIIVFSMATSKGIGNALIRSVGYKRLLGIPKMVEGDGSTLKERFAWNQVNHPFKIYYVVSRLGKFATELTIASIIYMITPFKDLGRDSGEVVGYSFLWWFIDFMFELGGRYPSVQVSRGCLMGFTLTYSNFEIPSYVEYFVIFVYLVLAAINALMVIGMDLTDPMETFRKCQKEEPNSDGEYDTDSSSSSEDSTDESTDSDSTDSSSSDEETEEEKKKRLAREAKEKKRAAKLERRKSRRQKRNPTSDGAAVSTESVVVNVKK